MMLFAVCGFSDGAIKEVSSCFRACISSSVKQNQGSLGRIESQIKFFKFMDFFCPDWSNLNGDMKYFKGKEISNECRMICSLIYL